MWATWLNISGAHKKIYEPTVDFIFKSKNAETVKTVHEFFLHNATRNFYLVNIFVVPILN